MNLKDKQELVRLLNLYQNELLELDKFNKRHDTLMVGIKAQYNHARVISTKISCEIEKEIKTV